MNVNNYFNNKKKNHILKNKLFFNILFRINKKLYTSEKKV